MGDPDVDVFYVEKTIVSEPFSEMTDYNSLLLSYNGNYYCSYSGNRYVCLTDEETEEVLEDVLGEQIGYVYGNNDVYWATYEDELDEVTDIGLIYQVKGYDSSETVAILFDNYKIKGNSSKAEGKNLYFFQCYTMDEDGLVL